MQEEAQPVEEDVQQPAVGKSDYEMLFGEKEKPVPKEKKFSMDAFQNMLSGKKQKKNK